MLLMLPTTLRLRFQELTVGEQAWRARVFLATWLLSANEMFSWSVAMGCTEADMRSAVKAINDQQLVAAVISARSQRRDW